MLLMVAKDTPVVLRMSGVGDLVVRCVWGGVSCVIPLRPLCSCVKLISSFLFPLVFGSGWGHCGGRSGLG